MNTNTYRKVLLYIEKEKSFEKEGLYDSSLKRTGCIERTGSFEKGQTLWGKTSVNTEESKVREGEEN